MHLRVRALELGKDPPVVPNAPVTSSPAASPQFDVSKHISLVPSFRETEVDSYFNAFERIAATLGWPRNVWSLLLQCKLIGKAQEVCATLSIDESLDYDVVKATVLRAYELVPEAYRQKFRTCRKSATQTHVEFAREKSNLLDKWCTACKVNDFAQLRELVLLEEFKSCVPERIVVYLNEQKVTSLTSAAVLADEFVLTHRSVFSSTHVDNSQASIKKTKPLPKGKPYSGAMPPNSRECYYCHEQGHIVPNCPVLAGREQKKNSKKPKSVSFVQASPMVSSDVNDPKEKADNGFRPFLFKGTVSLTDSEKGVVPVTILRDTGANQSLLLSSLLPFSLVSSCGFDTLVWGLKMSVVRAPMHTVFLRCPLVTGPAKVALRDQLPVHGVDMILGNDLAGERVFPALEVFDSPMIPASDPSLNDASKPSVYSACAVTRAQMRKMKDVVDLSETFLCNGGLSDTGEDVKPQLVKKVYDNLSFSDALLSLDVDRNDLIQAQRSDDSLVTCVSAANSPGEKSPYRLIDGILVREWFPPTQGDLEWNKVQQVVVPKRYRSHVLSLAHDGSSGHLGIRKTYNLILRYFFWPGLKSDVTAFCRSCHICQMSGKPNQVIPPAPLHPIPAIGEPFENLIIDCVGPLPRTKSGYQYILTLMCAATRYPEAIPLRTLRTKAIIKALVTFFSTFGLPKTIQSDQGSNFTSQLFLQVIRTLSIKHKMSSAYHPQSQGALERFHQTMKAMIKKFCLESSKEWDEGLPFLMLTVRESVHEATGFSPAELVFGHTVRGPLKLLQEKLVDAPGQSKRNVLNYVSSFRERLHQARAVARSALSASQETMKKRFDKKAVNRQFQVGDEVLAFLPIPGSVLQAKFSGPYVIAEKLSDTDYVVETPDRRRKKRVCHINMLKSYVSRDVKAVLSVSPVSPSQYCPEIDGLRHVESGSRLQNSVILKDLNTYLNHLDDPSQKDISLLINDHLSLFSDIPSRTTVVTHDIDVGGHPPIKQHGYRVNPNKRSQFRQEVDYLLQNGLAVPSSSSWSSPCLLVPKPDNTVRFCTDFRKVNEVTKTDSYPLPRMEDCVDRVGSAQFVTKLDMLKGYWQVPLSSRASEISAFVTPDHFLQYTVMPFGLKNAPATFQRLMHSVLSGVANCEVYLDDIVVYTKTWEGHMETLKEVFSRLCKASLTLNLAKCDFGKAVVNYLGKEVGRGQIRPLAAKVQAILDFPTPQNRKQLRRFLGMAGYYRGFCRNFAEVVLPLTSLTSVKTPFLWSPQCEDAFNSVKALLCSTPVLAAPDFGQPFKLEVDASDCGAGAVLLQEDSDGIEHPLCYFSKKFNQHQRRYSTIEKETLALLLALQHFEVYLGSSTLPIIIYTDHNPLVFLHRMQNSNQRLMRWSLMVQDFNLQILHKKGSENVLADALSRVSSCL